MIEEWIEKLKKVWTLICVVGMVFSGLYVVADILFLCFKFFTKEDMPNLFGEGSHYNLHKPILTAISDGIHSAPLLIVCMLIFTGCLYVVRKGEKQNLW